MLLTSTTHASSQEPVLSHLKEMLGASVEIRERANIHGKCVVVDGQHTVLMSANFAGDGVGLYSDWSVESHEWDRPAFELGIYVNDPAFTRKVIALVEELIHTRNG